MLTTIVHPEGAPCSWSTPRALHLVARATITTKLKPQNTTTSLLFSKNSTGSKYLNKWNIKSYHSHITHFNPPNPHTYISCSRSNHLLTHTYVSCSTQSSSTLTLLRPSVTSSLKFSNHSIAIAVPPLWNKLP